MNLHEFNYADVIIW